MWHLLKIGMDPISYEFIIKPKYDFVCSSSTSNLDAFNFQSQLLQIV